MRKRTPTIPVLAGTENNHFFKKILGKYDKYFDSNIYNKHTARTPYYSYCWLYTMMSKTVKNIEQDNE